MNHVLKGSSRTDLLCIPAIMLGFHPQDSCVVIALKGAAVAMCARVDLRWFAGDAERTLRQLNNALGNVPEARIVLVGFGDPDDASISVAELADALGWDRIADALISQGDRYWVVPATGAPIAFSFDRSALAAQAVFQGIRIDATRAEAVLPVMVTEEVDPDLVARCRAAVAYIQPSVGFAVLRELAESSEPLGVEEGLTLALLLGDEDRLGALATRLSTDTAPVIWPNLVAARRFGPPETAPPVLALLALASWLSGRGAAHVAALEELTRIDARHPLAGVLSALHEQGLPPDRWPL